MIPSLRFAPTTRRGGGTDPIFPLITKKKRGKEREKFPSECHQRPTPKYSDGVKKKKKKIKFEKKKWEKWNKKTNSFRERLGKFCCNGGKTLPNFGHQLLRKLAGILEIETTKKSPKYWAWFVQNPTLKLGGNVANFRPSIMAKIGENWLKL